MSQWDYATICTKIRGRGKSGPAAKEKTIAAADQVLEVLRKFEIGSEALKSTFSLTEDTRYRGDSEHEFLGYKATRHITAFVDRLDILGDLQDALTSIEGVEVEKPALQLSPDHRASLQETALEKAFEKAQRRWKHECKVMGFKPEQYYVGNYTATYSDKYRNDAGGNNVSTSAGDALEFHAGSALVSVELSLNFWDIKRKET